MKIEKLVIENYKQFKNLTLDFTYPKGHEKEGQPLDKICIIGQSGVGKTNILEIIRDRLYSNDVKAEILKDEESDSEGIYFVDIHSMEESNNIKMSREAKELINELTNKKDRLVFEEIDSIPKDKASDLYMKAYSQMNLLEGSIQSFSDESAINKKYRLINSTIRDIKNRYNSEEQNDKKKYITINESAWILLKERIKNYAIEEIAFNSKLFNKINIDNTYLPQSKIDKKEWESKNENIAEKISDKLNEILIKFNLKLKKIDENQKSYNDLTVEDLSNEKIIKYDDLSTGTKNIISTFIPLKIHNPKDSIILIDEPENSFYPDIQRMLTDLYMEVGENNQLIMATHSPLIASSFEPWEVVELKFNKSNKVYREEYFEGENHVDNYTLDPRLLTWTGILVDIFDMKEDSNALEREKALMRYIRLERELKNIEDKTLKKEKFEELMKLSDLLGLNHNEKN